MNAEYKKMMRRDILKFLDASAPYAMAEQKLFEWVLVCLSPKPVRSEFDALLLEMETRRMIVRVRNDDEVKVKITDEGRAELVS